MARRPLLAALGLPEALVSLASGDIQVASLPAWEMPPENYGFPPALIPLWSDGGGPSYYGYWRHWAVARSGTYVHVSVEQGYRASEIARTAEQLLRVVLLQAICTEDALSQRLRELAETLGVNDVERLNEISLSTGDDLRGLLLHPLFAADPPRACDPAPEAYRGDFPSSRDVAGLGELERVAGLELKPEYGRSLLSVEGLPPWLRTERQNGTFSALLRDGNVGGAWLSLNSPGWTFAEARRALLGFRAVVREPMLDDVIKAWCEEDHESAGGY